MSGGGVNRTSSPEVCEKISQALKGHIVSEETKKKISANHIDVSGENNPMYGKHHSDETKKKISEINKGRISERRNLTPVYCIDLNKIFNCAKDAADILGLHSSLILQCCYNKRKTTGGYRFKFLNMENDIS